MEHVNNDMDDLFRKAGDLYPLKTTDSDWDGVLGKLREENLEDQTAVPWIFKARRFKRRWLILLLLIPVGLGSVIYFSASKKQGEAIGLSVPDKVGNPNETGKAGSYPAVADDQQDHADMHKPVVQKAPDKVRLNEFEKAAQPKLKLNRDRNTNGVQGKKEKAATSGKSDAGEMTDAKNSLSAGSHGKKDYQSNNGKLNSVETGTITATATSGDEVQSNTASAHDKDSKTKSLSDSSSKETQSATVKQFSKERTNTPATVSKAKAADTKAASSKGFYIGLLAGPDLSSVKFQSVKQAGFSLGALVGYRFNKRLSVETGIMWDKKYYYSKGEYFDKSKIALAPYENIINLDGNCNMFEIPITVRYDFAAAKKHGFFFRAGLSTYLMKKENYSYLAKLNTGPSWTGDSTYYNTGNNILSIVLFSAGYEYAISPKTKIRIEPYLKIPLQGIGIGSMPISSAGFYLGISHSFR